MSCRQTERRRALGFGPANTFDPEALRIVTIRALAEADRAAVLSINAGARPAVAPLDAAELDRLRGLSRHHLVAATEAGAVVGYLLAFDDRCAYDGEEFQFFLAQLRRPFFYADQIAVASARQGSGLGRQLYQALVAHARAQSVATLCCEVNTLPPNPASLDFHRRLGFTVLGNGDTLDGRRVAFLVRNL